ncbi:unnamed protein product [marine sediment metagenome]|uniref:Uncharacterized protein n=1 Tax=marine sediment metagenome TaxID=412755 RepID=X1HXC7_9ZZZZ
MLVDNNNLKTVDNKLTIETIIWQVVENAIDKIVGALSSLIIGLMQDGLLKEEVIKIPVQ